MIVSGLAERSGFYQSHCDPQTRFLFAMSPAVRIRMATRGRFPEFNPRRFTNISVSGGTEVHKLNDPPIPIFTQQTLDGYFVDCGFMNTSRSWSAARLPDASMALVFRFAAEFDETRFGRGKHLALRQWHV